MRIIKTLLFGLFIACAQGPSDVSDVADAQEQPDVPWLDVNGPADATKDDAGSLDAGTSDGGPPAAQACPALDEENNEHGDLYNHHIKWASTNDGVNFQSSNDVLLEHASVPDAVVRPDGEVWVYFVNGNPGQHSVFVAKQLEDGTLETFDCVRIDGLINGNAVDPDVVLLDDGRYRLFFYQGWFVGDAKVEENHPFYSAVSEDGVHFTLEQELLVVDGGGTDPTAVKLADGSWLMALTHPDGVLLSSSTDGTQFSLTGVSLPKGIPEIALFDESVIRLYIAAREGLMVYRSEDSGESWTQEALSNLKGADPSIIQTGPSEWKLFLKGFSPK